MRNSPLGFFPVAILVALMLAAPASFADQKSKASSNHAKPTAKAAPEQHDPYCLRQTGSLIKPRKGHCVNAFGRSYSGKELQSTGQISVGAALQSLDPAIQSSPP